MDNTNIIAEALKDVLRPDESVMHPIFGYYEQDGIRYFSYFAFTETDFLIAHLKGNSITYTARLPLDITSVKIKKTSILKEHIIDILFSDGKSYKIHTFQNNLKYKSQKETLPLFLKRLKAKAKTQSKELQDIEGEKIRAVYFGVVIFYMLSFIPGLVLVIMISEMKKGNFDIIGMLKDTSGALPEVLLIFGIFLLPFIIIAFLNRLFLGKILAVVSYSTLYFENRIVSLNKIEEITYKMGKFRGKKRNIPSYATFAISSERSVEIEHFPLYGLIKIKKYNPNIRIKFHKSNWCNIFAPTLILVVFALLFG